MILAMEIVLQILVASWAMLGEMSPYLLLGFFVAGLLSVAVSPQWVERHLGRNGLSQVVKGSLVGVPLPLCSCGVLPVGASLRRHGASKGATTAFLLSTPQTGVDSIAVTWALLGPVVAIIRPVAAFVTGIVGGALVQFGDSNGSPAPDAPEHAKAPVAEDCCAPVDRRGNVLVRALRYGFVTLPRDIGRALVIGLLLSGVIAAFFGPHSLDGLLGGGVLPYLIAIGVGIPLYVCATASTPIAASLIGAGLSPGAALVFLITGPTTNGAALTTLLRVLGRRAVGIYLVTVIVCALATGVIVDSVLGLDGLMLPQAGAVSSAHAHHLQTGVFGLREVCSLALIAVLVLALWPRRRHEHMEEDTMSEDRVILTVKGMRCNGCVESVSRTISECAGVEGVNIDLGASRAVVTGSNLDTSVLCSEVTTLGFVCLPEDTPA